PADRSAPDHDTVPRVGSIRPATRRNAVDLPQPEGPSSDTNSPARRSRSKRSSATTPLANVLLTPCSVTATSPPVCASAAIDDFPSGASFVVHDLVRKPVPTFRGHAFVVHDLVRKPVSTFRGHALALRPHTCATVYIVKTVPGSRK